MFSCGWHITHDGLDVYSRKFRVFVQAVRRLGRVSRMVELDDQVEACRRVFASDTRWTIVRGSGLQEGESQGLPVWSRHVGDPILESNITRRVDFALFMVAALTNDALVHEAPAIVGCTDALGARARPGGSEGPELESECANEPTFWHPSTALEMFQMFAAVRKLEPVTCVWAA